MSKFRSDLWLCRDTPSNGLMLTWFGANGDQHLRLDQFQAFLVQLHHVFEALEFNILDHDGDGKISGLELARSLVAPAGVRLIDDLLNRVRCHYR